MSRAPSITDGVPREIDDDLTPIRRVVPVLRLVRGSTPPPLASLMEARDVLGELQTRRLATPLTIVDDRWEQDA